MTPDPILISVDPRTREEAVAAGPDAHEAFIRMCVGLAPGGFTDDFKFLLDRLDELRETQAWLIANSTPQHSATCAAQDDDDPCICGIGEKYERVLAASHV